MPVNNSSWSLSGFFYKNSMFHALNIDRIERETQEMQAKSRWEKSKFAVQAGAKTVLPCFVVSVLVASGVKYFFGNSKEASFSLTDVGLLDIGYIVVAGPAYEELIYRSIPHFAIGLVQKGAKHIAPDWIADTRGFKILTSPSTRIALGGLYFAAEHWGTAGVYLNTSDAVGMMASIFLYPVEGIIYETTGSVGYSMLSHMTYNALDLMREHLMLMA